MKHNVKLQVLAVLTLVLVVVGFAAYRWSQPKVLRLGFYAGSSWDVPHTNDYLVIDRAIALFEKAHPGVRVEYESGIAKSDYSNWLSDNIVSGQQPDVFIIPESDFNLLASTGALADLDKVLTEDFDRTNFYDASLQAGQFMGTQYALPFESNPMMMCINLDLLKKEGLDLPESGWTLADFYRICQEVTKDTTGDGIVDQYGFADYSWQQAIAAFGIDLFDASGTKANFDNAEVREVLELMQDLEALTSHYTVTSQDFDEGRVAFKPMTLAEYRTYRPYPYRVAKYSTFSWSCLPMPTGKDGGSGTQLSTSLFAVSSRTREAKLANEFLQLLCANQEVQQAVFDFSQGTAVIKSVMTSQETEERLKEEGFGQGALSLATLDSMLTQGMISPTFKKYNQVIEQADYLVSRAISQNDLDSLYTIQKELESSLQ